MISYLTNCRFCGKSDASPESVRFGRCPTCGKAEVVTDESCRLLRLGKPHYYRLGGRWVSFLMNTHYYKLAELNAQRKAFTAYLNREL